MYRGKYKSLGKKTAWLGYTNTADALVYTMVLKRNRQCTDVETPADDQTEPFFLVQTSAFQRRGRHLFDTRPTLVRPANILLIPYMRVYQFDFRRRRHEDKNVHI